MKYCPNCGTQLPDNANFCSHCGARFGAPQQNFQQPQYQQSQKMSYMDRVRQARAEQKAKQGSVQPPGTVVAWA